MWLGPGGSDRQFLKPDYVVVRANVGVRPGSEFFDTPHTFAA
jgi:hypothetical protein